MLLITGTTLNVQSFIGAIMAIGIAVANSILLLSFAEHKRLEDEGRSSTEAAEYGATSRLRAILMTASAMIFGMIPMALGLSEGGSQTAPLGRAVIGGLLLSTFATLRFLPAIYSILQQNASIHSPSLNAEAPSSRYYEQQQPSARTRRYWGKGFSLPTLHPSKSRGPRNCRARSIRS